MTRCAGGAEVGVDWVAGEVLHEGDDDWHPWDEEVYGPRANHTNRSTNDV